MSQAREALYTCGCREVCFMNLTKNLAKNIKRLDKTKYMCFKDNVCFLIGTKLDCILFINQRREFFYDKHTN